MNDVSGPTESWLKLRAELKHAERNPPTPEAIDACIAEAEAWGKEQEEKRQAAAAAALNDQTPVEDQQPPRRQRNLAREARLAPPEAPRQRRDAHHWGRLVADFIRTMPVPPKTPPPFISSQLQAAIYLSSVCGVTSREWLARTLQVNKRHASVLLSRARDVRTKKVL